MKNSNLEQYVQCKTMVKFDYMRSDQNTSGLQPQSAVDSYCYGGMGGIRGWGSRKGKKQRNKDLSEVC